MRRTKLGLPAEPQFPMFHLKGRMGGNDSPAAKKRISGALERAHRESEKYVREGKVVRLPRFSSSARVIRPNLCVLIDGRNSARVQISLSITSLSRDIPLEMAELSTLCVFCEGGREFGSRIRPNRGIRKFSCGSSFDDPKQTAGDRSESYQIICYLNEQNLNKPIHTSVNSLASGSFVVPYLQSLVLN